MEEIKYDKDILRFQILYLEKLELMAEEERQTLIQTIRMLNRPIFVTSK